MRQCSACHLSFTGDLDQCPLCGSHLTGSATPSPLPANTLGKKSKYARGWLALITLLCIILTGITAAAVHGSPLSTLAACAAILLNYLFVRNMIVHAPNFLRMVERYFLVILGICLLLFIATGWPALTSFVIPGLCLLATLSNTVLIIVFRDAFVQGYAKYLLYDLVLGFVPLLLMAFGLVAWPWLAVASAGTSVILLATLIIFARKQATSEMHKLFNA